MDPSESPSDDKRGGERDNVRRNTPVKRSAPARTTAQRGVRKPAHSAQQPRSMTRTSDYAYGKLRGAVRNTASRMGVENSRLAQRAEQQLKQTKRQWDQAERSIREYIRENPERAAAIAAGVGVAIGAALATTMGRRNRRR